MNHILSLSEFTPLFQSHFAAYWKKKINSIRKIVDDPFLLELINQTQTMALTGGKRLRPYIVYLMYKTAGGKNEKALWPILPAFELLHLFCLVHDDIIDHGLFRYGQPTLYRAFADRYRQAKRLGDLPDIGRSQAILLGDYLLNWAHEIFILARYSSVSVRQTVIPLWFTMIDQVIAGQLIDVDLTTQLTVKNAQINRKNALKTACYTFVNPLKIGLLLANGPNQKSLLDWSEKIGLALGSLYQLQDDYLDLVLDKTSSQETSYTDLESRQQTFFTQYIMKHGSPSQQKELVDLFGRSLTKELKQAAHKLFMASGALAAGEVEIRRRATRVRTIIENRLLEPAVAKPWLELMVLLEKRQR